MMYQMSYIKNLLKNLKKSEAGQGLVEYVLIIVLVLIALVGALQALTDGI